MFELFNRKHIAIVGNSQSLFDFSYGLEIDSHEVVCRINRGVIIKDYKVQGTKINVWAYSILRIVEDLFSKVKCHNTIHLSEKHRKTRVDGKKLKQFQAHAQTKFWYPMETLKELQQALNYDRPSSGLILLYLVYRCNPASINLFGFDWKKTPTWYFQESITEHNWQLEKKFVKENFLNKSNITLKKNNI